MPERGKTRNGMPMIYPPVIRSRDQESHEHEFRTHGAATAILQQKLPDRVRKADPVFHSRFTASGDSNNWPPKKFENVQKNFRALGKRGDHQGILGWLVGD